MLRPRPAALLTGNETLSGLDATVSEFWRWAFSDLRENITRGVLAEFLVARALGERRPIRSAWDDYDVETPTGTKVEVKSAAYLQSWPQRKLSRITFSGLTARRWSTPQPISVHRGCRHRHVQAQQRRLGPPRRSLLCGARQEVGAAAVPGPIPAGPTTGGPRWYGTDPRHPAAAGISRTPWLGPARHSYASPYREQRAPVTRGCFRNPTRNRGRIIGSALITEGAKRLRQPVAQRLGRRSQLLWRLGQPLGETYGRR